MGRSVADSPLVQRSIPVPARAGPVSVPGGEEGKGKGKGKGNKGTGSPVRGLIPSDSGDSMLWDLSRTYPYACSLEFSLRLSECLRLTDGRTCKMRGRIPFSCPGHKCMHEYESVLVSVDVNSAQGRLGRLR